MPPDPPSDSYEATSFAKGDQIYYYRNGMFPSPKLPSRANSCGYKTINHETNAETLHLQRPMESRGAGLIFRRPYVRLRARTR